MTAADRQAVPGPDDALEHPGPDDDTERWRAGEEHVVIEPHEDPLPGYDTYGAETAKVRQPDRDELDEPEAS